MIDDFLLVLSIINFVLFLIFYIMVLIYGAVNKYRENRMIFCTMLLLLALCINFAVNGLLNMTLFSSELSLYVMLIIETLSKSTVLIFSFKFLQNSVKKIG